MTYASLDASEPVSISVSAVLVAGSVLAVEALFGSSAGRLSEQPDAVSMPNASKAKVKSRNQQK